MKKILQLLLHRVVVCAFLMLVQAAVPDIDDFGISKIFWIFLCFLHLFKRLCRFIYY